MSEAAAAYSRGQFIRNAAKGSLVLVGSGGVLASMDGIAFAKPSGLTKSDIKVLQTGYIAETLAVTIYGAIVSTYFRKLKLDPGNLSYFKAALADEKAHLAAWKKALGPKNTPTGFKLTVPGKYVASKKALASTGVALEEAFVATYLGAIDEFSSSELKTTAGAVAANEATHYSFFDAILPNGNAVLPAFGPKPITAGAAAATLTKLGFLS
ncbi:MAG: ferritin-like domain-containing protein [Acidobacteriota bacterium]|nr:ferritin-like domain-containing protein [Acidobacteriota bacterium]